MNAHTAGPLRLALGLVLLLGLPAAADVVYKTVDEDGNVVFSDTPQDGAEQIWVEDAQTIAPPPPPEFVYTPPPEQVPAVSLSIGSPGDDEAVRSNDGSVTVTVQATPDPAPDYTIVVFLDGQEAGTGSSVSLSNVDRGTHRLHAQLRDAEGAVQAESAPTTFHLLRPSVANAPAPAPKPPAPKPGK